MYKKSCTSGNPVASNYLVRNYLTLLTGQYAKINLVIDDEIKYVGILKKEDASQFFKTRRLIRRITMSIISKVILY